MISSVVMIAGAFQHAQTNHHEVVRSRRHTVYVWVCMHVSASKVLLTVTFSGVLTKAFVAPHTYSDIHRNTKNALASNARQRYKLHSYTNAQTFTRIPEREASPGHHLARVFLALKSRTNRSEMHLSESGDESTRHNSGDAETHLSVLQQWARALTVVISLIRTPLPPLLPK